MKDYTTANLHNVALIGHGGDGKTSLAEAMLYLSGSIERMGKTADGTTTTDYDPEEIKRTISISAALAPFEWKDKKVTVIDLPGYFDFMGELTGPMKIADCALIVMSAVAGMEVGTEKAMKMSSKGGVPHMIVINQMDRENANFDKCLEELKEKYGSAVAPIIVPIMDKGAFAGYANVLTGKGFTVKGKTVSEMAVPAGVADQLASYKEELSETAAGVDEELMEKFFEEGELSDEEIQKGLRLGIGDASIVPVVCCSAVTGMGVSAIMDMICDVMPNSVGKEYTGVNPKTGDTETRKADVSEPFSAQVFKTVADPFVGKLSLIKVFSGVLTGDMTLYNPNSEKNEKAGTVYMMRGKKQTAVDKLIAGDIGALAKLQNTATGNTLCDAAKPIKYEEFKFPKPVISLAVVAKKQGEEDKIATGLNKLMEEDPTFSIEKTTDTKEMVMSAQGELQLEVLIKKLQAKFGAEASFADPKIPYRETIRKSIKAEGRHKKQSGGHGQFGHCWVEFEPIFDGGEEFEFVDKVVGGVVPRSFIPAVEKGLRENLPKGIIAGYPIVNLRATLYDGSYHPVDSSEMAFKIAARLALKKCVDASPVLLEPVYSAKITVPDEYMGDIMGDMNRRRGRVMGMNPVEDGQEVEAEVPLSEMFKYATDLRSMTQARGSFTMEFVRYEEVPQNIAQKIIENAAKNKVDEDDD
ncbi:MAG: elongation factor G [Clostridiales bacterium]|nr:elongation factor G [Clostridiales bacterium]